MKPPLRPKDVHRLVPELAKALVVVSLVAVAVLPVLALGDSPASATSGTSNAGASSSTYPATGYFSVTQKQSGNGWTLVTPQGEPFYASGIDTVSPNGSGTDQVTGVCPYCATVANDFPSTSAWATSTAAQIRSWGFNTLGPFSDTNDLASQMPYEVQLSMASGNDWFAPSFVAHADQVAQTEVAPLADDPNLIGYFTDSELGWGPLTGNGVGSFDTVLQQYLQLPAGSPGLAIAEQHVDDPTGFLTALATRYFSVTTAAIRMYDTNHLILGAKAEGQEIEPALVKAAAPYVNVFSVDDYALQPGLAQTVDNIWPAYLPVEQNLANLEAEANVPLMIGEYSFMAPSPSDPGNSDPWYLTADSQQQRASQFETYIAPLYEDTPNLVGDDWFQYVDEPANGRVPDGENSDFGMVNVNGVPYAPMVSAMQLMHGVVADETGDSGPVCDSWATSASVVNCTADMPSSTASPLTIVTTSLPTGYVASSYNTYTGGVYAAGGTPGYTYAITQGSLPTGLTLNAGSGIISGYPTTAGTSSFTVQATDSGGSPPASQALSITIDPEVKFSIPSAALQTGTENAYYQDILGATGGTWPDTWAITAGAMPSGLTLNSDGVINGLPTVAGTFTFTVKATDSSSPAQTATKTLTLNIPPTTSVLLPSSGATLQGPTWLDAGASSQNGIASVQFEISGGSISDQVIGNGTPTYYGFFSGFNSAAYPNGTYTMQSVATDDMGLSTTSAPLTVTIANPPTTKVLVPGANATIQGTTSLDAGPTNNSGITSVQFEISGGSVSDQVLGTATQTRFGYLSTLNTKNFANGTYTIQSVATDAQGLSSTSAPVTVTIANLPLASSVVVPATGGTLTNGSSLDATTSGGDPPIASVTFELSGNGLSDTVVATAVPSVYGWLAKISTAGIPTGTYTLQSVAVDGAGTSATSAGVTVAVTGSS